jgi:uncharacterized protein (TIGR02246 family)
MPIMLRLIGCLVGAAALAGCGGEAAEPDAERDRAAIEAALRQWPSDFNAENLDGVCGLFADDVVLIYPGSPDRGRREFCDQMGRLFDDPTRTFTYDQPDVREVLVDGDLATVRLIWPLTVWDTSGKVLETIDENGVDVFRRQADGSWKIHVSHAFTQE